MNFQNLIICDSKVIFDILNEIKEELNCNLLFKTKKEVLKISNLENYLILTVQKIDSLENQILIDNFPIQINKLLEIININLLKKNFNFPYHAALKAKNDHIRRPCIFFIDLLIYRYHFQR